MSGQTLRFDAQIHYPGTPIVTTAHLNTVLPAPAATMRQGGFSVNTVTRTRSLLRDEEPAIGDLEALAVIAIRRGGQLDHLNSPAVRGTVPIAHTGIMPQAASVLAP
jgi:hypothetical protein